MMPNRILSSIVIGVLLLTVSGCRTIPEDELLPDGTDEVQLSNTTPVATATTPKATVTPTPRTTDVPPPPPRPTPQPTSSLIPDWERVGSKSSGLEFSVPLSWVSLTDSIDTAAATSPLGLTVLLLADSQRTGRSLLAGKELNEGAFAAGLISNQTLPASDPVTALTQLMADQGTAVTLLTEAQLVKADVGSDVVVGASIDISGDPLGFLDSGGEGLRTRLLLYLSDSDSSAQDGRTATLFLFSALADQWEVNRYGEIFDQMAASIIIHDVQTGYTLSGGDADVMGSLIDGRVLSGELTEGVKNVWTFTVESASYVTLSLEPEDDILDLTLTLISPFGQTIAQIDSGYAGDTEVAADIYLMENGRYVVEVSDFFGLAGHYKLSLTIEDEPQYTNAGVIRPGQAIESELPVNAQHVWTFEGAAGSLISIVLSPRDSQMDAILNMFGPDGSRLVALDEGFSGDPEVVSGFELPVTGSYAIRVSSFADNGGRYALSLDEGGEATQNFYDAGDLLYGDRKSEMLNSNEAHAWFFQGRLGDEVRIVVRPLTDILDLEVWLFDPAIERLTARDEFAAGDTETLEFTLPQEGQYLILVREFFGEAGSYEIELSATPATVPEFAGRLSYDEPVDGTLAPQQMALWLFTADEADALNFTLTPGSDSEDMVLILQDPQGNTVIEVDDEPAGQSETISGFIIPADGQWSLVVKSFFEEAGTYSLLIQRVQ
ncbi:MAG: hypothetical protein H6667_16960 [Ardenticatenaceae bacterium]|nr:hypothetical protein [Ardenticatenaceae bacterium]MCB9443142.1 hypothetical protein [Ardenticatenaceae bacterium]